MRGIVNERNLKSFLEKRKAGKKRNCSETKGGYIFTGWYTDKACTKPYNFDRKLTEDTTLYAGWKKFQEKPNGITGGIMKIQGTTSAMEYASSVEQGAVWTSCQDGNTAVPTEGMWYVRYKETNEYAASEAVSVNVISADQAVADYITKNGISESTVAITDKVIKNTKQDTDLKGSSFVGIQARATKTAKKTIKLQWNKIKKADGYEIYGAPCNTKKKKNAYKLLKVISKKTTTSNTQKKLKQGTYYKYIVRAYKEIEGQRITLAASKTFHATTAGGKYGNAKSVKIKTDKKMKSQKGNYTLTIKKNKKYTIKASEVKQSKKIKVKVK